MPHRPTANLLSSVAARSLASESAVKCVKSIAEDAEINPLNMDQVGEDAAESTRSAITTIGHKTPSLSLCIARINPQSVVLL
ncbi:hypothetical protein BJY59DRAFT_725229, partial [Rhodotorula toruloides]